MHYTWISWTIFNVAVGILLMLDLFVFHRHSHVIRWRESLLWSAFWILLALSFNAVIYYVSGVDDALSFLTGYTLEKALSVDNLFVFLAIFSYFKTPTKYQHKVLFWGILGAIAMRLLFIFGGIALLQTFHWVVYIFGMLLIATGMRMFFKADEEIHPELNPVLILIRKYLPLTPDYVGGRFFVGRAATPLFLVLVVVELTDVIFALDSLPAVLAITRDPFLVYTSNICAILGLRSLYFAMAHVAELFHYLHYGLATILVFIGGKMIMEDIYSIPISVTLAVVCSTLAISIAASLLFPKGNKGS